MLARGLPASSISGFKVPRVLCSFYTAYPWQLAQKLQDLGTRFIPVSYMHSSFVGWYTKTFKVHKTQLLMNAI